MGFVEPAPVLPFLTLFKGALVGLPQDQGLSTQAGSLGHQPLEAKFLQSPHGLASRLYAARCVHRDYFVWEWCEIAWRGKCQ